MPSFNLITEPWIPLLHVHGHLHLVGLADAFECAHDHTEVYCDSPLETASLYRLLLAITIDAVLPKPDPAAWMAAWHRGHFDPAVLDAYFQRHHDRFDLLHAERPFYQHPEPLASSPATLSRLFHVEASGNNGTLFGHQADNAPRDYTLAEVARGVVCAQAASLGGGNSVPFNLSKSPLVGGALFWIRGDNLFEALLLNAAPEAAARMMGDPSDPTGLAPAWERPLPDVHERRPVNGYRDYLTWQSRRLTLVTEADEDGHTQPTGVYITQGDKDDPGVSNDPLMATVRIKNKDPFPFGFRTDRALWRDAHLIFQLFTPEEGGSPPTFRWLSQAARFMGVDRYRIDVFGMTLKKGKQGVIDFWRHEQMPVFPALLTAAGVSAKPLAKIRQALELAEEQEDTLRYALRTTADYLLAPPLPGSDEAPKPDAKASRNLVEALGGTASYWAALEPAFHSFLATLADQAEAPPGSQQEIVWQWAEDAYKVARDAYRQATAHLDQDAQQLRAVAQGERRLMRPKSYRAHRKANSPALLQPAS